MTASLVEHSLPDLPAEVLDRIIDHALALPPLNPGPPGDGSELLSRAMLASHGWGPDVGALRAASRRITRDARAIMMVCKAWKMACARYLYAFPSIEDRAAGFIRAIERGERCWSDIHLHPVATPGRWVRALHMGELGFSSARQKRAPDSKAYSILPLMPNLEHLHLDGLDLCASGMGRALRDAPFLPRLKSLRGIVTRSRDPAELIRLLNCMPRLEILELEVQAPPPPLHSAALVPDDGDNLLTLDLPLLHSLKLGCLDGSDVECSLPALRRLSVCIGTDGAIPLQQSHGKQITSLTLLLEFDSDPGGVERGMLGTAFPNLRSLCVCQPERRASLPPRFLGDLPSSLRTLVLQSAPLLAALSYPPSDHDPDGEGFRRLIASPPAGLRDIVLIGHRWLDPKMGGAALDSGASGRLRALAKRLRHQQINLRDEHGNLAPPGRTGPIKFAKRVQRRSTPPMSQPGTRPRIDVGGDDD